ncbi:MAG TPA: VWA domain-containing protein [Thermoanaerobaculia bacterium]
MISASVLLLSAVLLATQTPASEAPLPAPPPALARIELPVQILDRKGEVPQAIKSEDLVVLEDGQPRRILDLAPVSPPWRIVVYVDRVLSSSRTLRTAAGALAQRAPELAALGTVEVVVAEPQPREVLPATRDVKMIDEALSRLWLSGEGRDDLRVLRQRFREEAAAQGESPAERAAEAVETEARLVRRQQDAFAEWLLAQTGDGPRALLLVSDGFDRDPAAFYAPGSQRQEGALEKTALETVRTAAALGWTALPLPVGDSNLPDLRRIRPSSTPQVPIGVTIPLGRKKPKEPGKDQPPPLPALLAPDEPLAWLAEATGGEVVLQAQNLAGALARLRSRFWLRYEAPRETDGRPRAVEVRAQRSDLSVRARRWDAAGIPEEVAAARARRLLEGEEDGGGLEISARIQPDATAPPAERRGTLDLRIESPDIHGPFRLTVAGPGSAAASHRLLTADLAGPEAGAYRISVPLPEEAEAVAVLVGPLAGGAWGGQVVTLSGQAAEPDALSVSRPVLRIVPPSGDALAGRVRLKVNGGGEGIARVEVKAGDRAASACPGLPCETEVDLGRRIRPQVVQAVAYDAAGRELARDSVRINDPGEAFQVRIVEPAAKKGVGPVEVEADVRAPSGKRVERVEFFWNDELAGTLYAPPFRHRVMVPRGQPVGYLKVAARLEDGSTAEDAVALNASDIGDRIDVRLVQLAVVVTDPSGKPVPGLPKEAFRLRQDGREQEISAFENAGELPLTVALAIDSSASMFLKLPDVRKAVASLLESGLTNRDRALLIDFDTEPRLVKPVTRDLAAVSSSLRALTADGGTALWNAISFSLAQLRGISGRKALVVYSDGIDEGERFSFSSCLAAARGSGIPIYLIVANPRAARGEDGGFLSEPSAAKFQRLTEAGGGQVYFIERDQDLSGVYQQILSELRSQYTLAFYPRETAEGRGRIEVEVAGRKGLTARTVSGVPSGR